MLSVALCVSVGVFCVCWTHSVQSVLYEVVRYRVPSVVLCMCMFGGRGGGGIHRHIVLVLLECVGCLIKTYTLRPTPNYYLCPNTR